MLRSVKDMIGYPVKASDGRIGRVTDCLFEEESWHMRHIVVDTGVHFKIDLRYMEHEGDPAARRRDVLIEPEDVEELGLGWIGRKLKLAVTKDEVEHSPGLETDAPVSKQYEDEFTQYFHHTPYGPRPRVWDDNAENPYEPPESAYEHPKPDLQAHINRIREISRNHLQSAVELMEYTAEAADDSIGRIEDLILSELDWSLRHLVVRVGAKVNGKRVLIRSNAISEVSWSDQAVRIDMLREDVEGCPLFRPHAPVNRSSNHRFFDYYGKPIESDRPSTLR